MKGRSTSHIMFLWKKNVEALLVPFSIITKNSLVYQHFHSIRDVILIAFIFLFPFLYFERLYLSRHVTCSNLSATKNHDMYGEIIFCISAVQATDEIICIPEFKIWSVSFFNIRGGYSRITLPHICGRPYFHFTRPLLALSLGEPFIRIFTFASSGSIQ